MAKLIKGSGVELEEKVDETREATVSHPLKKEIGPKRMYDDAYRVLRDYFEGFGHKIFMRGVNEQVISSTLIPRVAAVIPFAYKFHPCTLNDWNALGICPQKPDRHLLKSYLEVDLTGFDLEEPLEVMPEVVGMRDILDVYTQRHFKYMVVMAMEGEHRSLAALAINSRQEEDTFPTTFSTGSTPFARVALYTPTLKEIINVAEEYGMTKVKPVLEELTATVKSFTQTWNGGLE